MDYSHEEDDIGRCFVSDTTGHNGRPKVEVSTEIIERLFEIHRSWQTVASILGNSVRTLRRRRTDFQMTVSNPIGPRINNVREIIDALPDSAESYVTGSLRSRGFFIQRHRIAINKTDPVDRALRKSPNSLW